MGFLVCCCRRGFVVVVVGFVFLYLVVWFCACVVGFGVGFVFCTVGCCSVLSTVRTIV